MSARSLNTAIKVLSSESLETGANRISPLESDSPRGVHAFKATLGTLEGDVSWLIALLSVKEDDAQFEECRRFLEHAASNTQSVFLFSAGDGARRLQTLTLDGTQVEVQEIAALFNLIFRLPHDFQQTVLTLNLDDFVTKQYDETFEDRQGRVLNSPLVEEDSDYSTGKIVNVKEYLTQWAAADSLRPPLLVLGDRVRGKTWQVFNFCDLQYTRHARAPWDFGPAFYLHLKEVRDYFLKTSHAMPSFAKIILKRVRGMRVPWNDAMLEAFMNAGHTVLCLDSVDEILPHPTTEEVREHIRRISSALSADSKFMMTCRTTHFDSIADLLNMEVWPGRSIRDSYDVLELLPFDEGRIRSYIRRSKVSAVDREGSLDAEGLVAESVDLNPKWALEEKEMLAVTVQQPAMLAAFVDLIKKRKLPAGTPALQWLQRVLHDAVLGFNLENRTTDYVQTKEGAVIEVDLADRILILEDLAWYMAERKLDTLDLRHLPLRMALLCKTEMGELQREIRSQTLFELSADHAESAAGHVRFTLRRGPRTFTSLAEMNDDLSARQDLKLPLCEAPVATTSVAGAYFVARHIVRDLGELSLFVKELDAVDRLRSVGSKPLGPLCACMVASLIESGTFANMNLRLDHIRIEAIELLRNAKAQRDPVRVDPRTRYLARNLAALKIATTDELSDLDVWV